MVGNFGCRVHIFSYWFVKIRRSEVSHFAAAGLLLNARSAQWWMLLLPPLPNANGAKIRTIDSNSKFGMVTINGGYVYTIPVLGIQKNKLISKVKRRLLWSNPFGEKLRRNRST